MVLQILPRHSKCIGNLSLLPYNMSHFVTQQSPSHNLYTIRLHYGSASLSRQIHFSTQCCARLDASQILAAVRRWCYYLYMSSYSERQVFAGCIRTLQTTSQAIRYRQSGLVNVNFDEANPGVVFKTFGIYNHLYVVEDIFICCHCSSVV